MNNIGNVLRFGLPYVRRYRGRFIAGVLLGVLFGLSNAAFLWATDTLIKRMSAPASSTVVSSAAEPAEPVADAPGPIGEWMNRLERRVARTVDPWLPALGRTLDWRQILGGLFLFPLLGLFRGFIGYLSSYCLAWVSERVVNDLRLDVLEKISGLSLDFFNRSTMGDLMTRVTGDTAALQRCLSLGLSDLIKEPVTVVAILGGLCLIDWQLTLGAAVFFPLCVLPMIVLGRKVRRASKSSLKANISQSSLLVEMIHGIRVIKAFGLESVQLDRFRRLTREWFHHSMKGVRAKELVNPFIETIALLGFGILIVFIAFQQRSFANMVVFLTGMAFIYTPIKRLAGLHVLFQHTSVGVGRLIQILHEQPTVIEATDPRPLTGFNTALEFQGVAFSYGNQMVLQGVHLRLPRGMKLGVAGESGSGKSTLVNLLFRFYDPTMGTIRIDGEDIRRFSLHDLRRQMALVSQEIVLFDLTVAENIACGKPGASREEIETAARAAFAHNFIQQMPQQYDTPVGERGVTLSGGQRQRIAIARAFIRNAPILVLDEATASLDSQSESEVQAAIEKLEENRTVICVAHRLSTLAGMDLIIVLSEGRVVEEGGFDELLERQGSFAAMAAKQGIVLPMGGKS